MMHDKTIAELSEALAAGTITSESLTEHYLDRMKAHQSALNAFITIDADGALSQARLADSRRKAGNAGPLTGIPIAHKDIFCTDGLLTTCGSKMLSNFVSPYDATLIEKFKQAGCVTLGKTNMDEFAMGSSNENSYYGPVRNPWDTNRVPGGSSGGSAAAIAARLAPGSTGTDTGGSIRQPAAFCGITGLKPTYGRVSRYGMIAFASSLDQAGPMTQTAQDAALLLEIMSGFDPRDSTSIDTPVPAYSQAIHQPIKGMKIGLPKEYFDQNMDASIRDGLNAAIDVLKSQGAIFKEISLPSSLSSISAYYILAPAECSSNLSRFDGVRFGHRCEDPKDLMDLYTRSRQEGFGSEVKRRIMIGTYVLTAGFYDAYYGKAQKIRRLISDDFKRAFSEVDVILSPTTPTPAFGLGEKTKDPVTMYLCDVFTIAVNLAGLPALSLPMGFVNGLPMGMQLIGNLLDESRILQVAHQYQLVTDWHKAIPAEFKGK